MRSDAQRNRLRLLASATELIIDVGPEPPLEAIARRAGVGIATLYRNFPDRKSLIEAVAARALELSAEIAEGALAESESGLGALRRYMHEALDAGIGVLNAIHPLISHDTRSHARSAGAIDAILRRAGAEGSIREGVTIPDIGFAIIRFSRPVARGVSSADEAAIAHRHLDVYIDGLSEELPRTPLPHPDALDLFDPMRREPGSGG